MIDIATEEGWEAKVREMLADHFGAGTSFVVVAWTNETIACLTQRDFEVWPPVHIALIEALKMEKKRQEAQGDDSDTVH